MKKQNQQLSGWGIVGAVSWGGVVLGSFGSMVAQNVNAFGVLEALTGSRLGLMHLDWAALGQSAGTGAIAGAVVGGLIAVSGLSKNNGISLQWDGLGSWIQKKKQAGQQQQVDRADESAAKVKRRMGPK